MVLVQKTQCTAPCGLLMCHLLSYKCHSKMNHSKVKTEPSLCFLVARYLALNSHLSTQENKDGVSGQPGLHLLGLSSKIQTQDQTSKKQTTLIILTFGRLGP